MAGELKRVAIVTPVFNEVAGLQRYYDEIQRILLNREDYRFTVYLIDDGSTDGTWAIIEQLCAQDSRLQGLRLSRNFGAHTAISCGFHQIDDFDAAVVLACDLQDPPEVVLEFLQAWQKGAKIVWGKRRSRQDTWWRVIVSRIFNRLLRRYVFPKGSLSVTGSFLLADRRVVHCYRQFMEHNRVTFALVAWTGFNQAVVEYDRKHRVSGQSGWKLSSMFKTMYDIFISFSTAPIRLIVSLAAMFFVSGLAFSGYLVYLKLNDQVNLMGWTGIMTGLSFLFSIQFLINAVQGEYLSRIHTESTGRPQYFVSDQTGDSPDQSPRRVDDSYRSTSYGPAGS